MSNSLQNKDILPVFSQIQPERIEANLKVIIQQNRLLVKELLAKEGPFTWENLIAPLEEMGDQLGQFWGPVAHLHAVAENEALRKAYNDCLPLLSDYHTEFLQNEKLYQAIQSIADSKDYSHFNRAQHQVIDNDLRDFKLAGVGLSPDKKTHFAELQKHLSTLTAKFSENVLDATHAWTFHVTDSQLLTGLHEQTLHLLEENAQHVKAKGWVMTLDYPCYSTVMKYLDNREIRRVLYEAYATRASDQGPHAGRFDNSNVMENILKIRNEMAQLLGFKNYVDYSLATKMATSSQQILDFLHDLVVKAKTLAAAEIQELQQFAKKIDGLEQLESWDVPYYTEKLRAEKYALQQEDLRPYFPINKVLSGLFTIMNKVFGINIVERKGVDIWHPHVQFFDIYDDKNELRGSLYMDLYARPHKREGAWMDECRVRRQLMDGSLQYPVAFLTCNFNRPLGNRPALLTHDDVLTLFHEFGHCIHHLLTKIDYASVSGINGVLWDAVEVPSQFLERWCFEKESLALISQHIDTNEPLPDFLYQKIVAAKNFQAGMFMLRQLEFALFDLTLHLTLPPPTRDGIQTILDDIRNELSTLKPPRFNRFQNTFSHIFAGGYAAGYYSYLWAEVLSSDAYAKFEETGIFNRKTGNEFLTHILEQGGAQHPMDLFVAFRGRKPTIDAFLKHNGIETNLE